HPRARHLHRRKKPPAKPAASQILGSSPRTTKGRIGQQMPWPHPEGWHGDERCDHALIPPLVMAGLDPAIRERSACTSGQNLSQRKWQHRRLSRGTAAPGPAKHATLQPPTGPSMTTTESVSPRFANLE